MKPVYIYNQNILNTKYQLIAQQCHCNSKIKKGAGLAAKISKKLPYADFYVNRKKDSVPGTIKVVGKGKKRWVCAMFAQFQPGKCDNKETSEVREAWFKSCLDKIGKIKNLREIAFPYKIGCGLAGGDWNSYKTMIEKFAFCHKIKVYIVCLEYPIEKIREQPFLDWLNFEIISNPNLDTTWLKEMYGLYHDYLHCRIEDNDSEETRDIQTPTDSWAITSLEDYTTNNIPKGWENFFREQLDNGVISSISTYLVGESRKTEIYPELFNVYKMFNLASPDEIKVLILGQDPFISKGEAIGIAFSVPSGVKVPPSLRNIYKEMENDGFIVKDKKKGDLTKWCKQGVFMLNTALTVGAHESGSHLKKWNDKFTVNLMKYLDDNCNPLVIILWGAFSQSFGKYFGERHRKIISPHPSPFSAKKGFFGSKPFSRANGILSKTNRLPIDWNL